jgi:hypothetical protein
MNKEEAKCEVGNQYNIIIHGKNSFLVEGVTYEFIDGFESMSGLNWAKQVALLTKATTVKFKDINNVYDIPLVDFDKLLATIVLTGNSLWEKKIAKYELIHTSTTDEELETIVNSAW